LRATNAGPVPNQPGVYVVWRRLHSHPDILDRNHGGHFKRRDPTMPRGRLLRKWVAGANILYFGKTGTSRGHETLRKRIRTYLSFGAGNAVAHWGGRAIWQIGDSEELLLGWRITNPNAARPTEKRLLEQFRACHRALPFANWRV